VSGTGDILAAAIPGLLLYAAFTDLTSRRLSNRLCALVAVLALAWQFGQAPARIWAPLAAGLLVLVPLGWFWSRGWLGGGDVKFATALAFWAGLSDLPELLLVTTLAGGIVALGVLLRPWFAQRLAVVLASLSALGLRPAGGVAARLALAPRGVPYGVALAGGGLWIWVQRFPAPGIS